MRHLSLPGGSRWPTAQGLARPPSARPCARRQGLSLVELVVVLAILGLMLAAAAPSLADYATNSRLRESGHQLLGEALMAQSEAAKRNAPVRLSLLASGVLQLHDLADPANPVLLRERRLAVGVTAAATSFTYRGDGRLSTNAGVAIDLGLLVGSCSAELRCPGLRVDAGGPPRLCPNHLDSCS